MGVDIPCFSVFGVDNRSFPQLNVQEVSGMPGLAQTLAQKAKKIQQGMGHLNNYLSLGLDVYLQDLVLPHVARKKGKYRSQT